MAMNEEGGNKIFVIINYRIEVLETMFERAHEGQQEQFQRIQSILTRLTLDVKNRKLEVVSVRDGGLLEINLSTNLLLQIED